MNNSEFYIGWQPQAPERLAKHSQSIVIILFLLIAGVGTSLALLQKRFSTARFEFGQLTEVKGIYQSFPVPALKVFTGNDAFGNSSFITMPLVGYGKSGAEGVIAQLEKNYRFSFDNHEITVKGTLLYSDGKTLLQIDQHDHPLVKVREAPVYGRKATIAELGTVKLTGEVLDPKCYFGVMKPGHGKPHRDCAIRCIEGGMSPVFYVRNKNGEANYYLLLDEAGTKMNSELKDYIAEPVWLEARAVQYDDWIVLYVRRGSIRRTGGLSWFKVKDGDISCGKPNGSLE
ncbi:MAG: hypothetical protein J0L56_18290 [Chitinophagales bacterium]|nr:hypothetical protein [Chitinophagales bacterium]